MKYISLLLSIISLTNTKGAAEGVTVEEELKITDSIATGKCLLKVQEGDLVTWTAYGYLLDGVIFDVGEYKIKIGNGEAPKGIDQGLRGLCVGDQRSLRIHSDFIYIIYDVKILGIDRNVQERRISKTKDEGLKNEERKLHILMNKFVKYGDTNKVEDCGMRVERGDQISWHYVGKFTNGTAFDKGDFRAKIDNGEVIHGVNEAMKGLCVGGTRVMVMHHSYAYGSKGTGNIPPNSTLIFKVHLKSIDRPFVGWEDLEIKHRKASVSKETPIKITDLQKTGNCDIKVKEGDVISWKCVGYLLTGKIFDDVQVLTTIGDGKTIAAIENGLLGLCVADTRSITIHPDAAFGSRGASGMVPINATVIYDVTIIDINKRIEL